jgi:hypothetical protein
MRLNRQFPLWLALCLAAGMLSGCETIQPVRTLPSWVRGIYIPMFENQTSEPGLEEVATQLTQEKFLEDGRVRIVRKQDADLILRAEIIDYRTYVEETSDDDIASRTVVTLFTDLKLYDPIDPERPMASLGRIETISTHNSDARSSRYVTKPDAIRQALKLLGQQIVHETIEGFPTQLRDIPDGVVIPGQGGPVRAEDESSDRPSRFPFF